MTLSITALETSSALRSIMTAKESRLSACGMGGGCIWNTKYSGIHTTMYAVFAIAIMCFLNTITAHIAAREWMARPMAYESPIELFVQDLNWKIEGEIATAVRKVGVNVDKDELLKALAYERDQYQKGYEDGRSDAVRHGFWNWNLGFPYCSECKKIAHKKRFAGYHTSDYCPNCGAEMKR